MKLGKRILAMGLALMIICNSCPKVYAAPKIQLELAEEITSSYLDTKVGSSLVYGNTPSTYTFEDILIGVEWRDDVHLVADVEYTQLNTDTEEGTDEETGGDTEGDTETDADGIMVIDTGASADVSVGTYTMSFDNFRLEGQDAEDYVLVSTITAPVEKGVQVTPKEIKIAPAKTWNYYGQTLDLTTVADYSAQVINGDIVPITAEFEIVTIGDEKGFAIVENTLQCDNPNYTVVVDGDARYEEREYNTDVVAISDPPTSNYVGVKTAKLIAPTNFLISTENGLALEWKTEITIDLDETSSGKAYYRLRNNNSVDTEEYLAISTVKEYTYTSDQSLPEITSITVSKQNASDTLNFLDFGIFGNGSVNVEVEAKGTTAELPTTIYLSENGAEGSYMDELGSAQNRNGMYYYTANYELNIDTQDADATNDKKTANLVAYAGISLGDGEKFTKVSGVNDRTGASVTPATKQIVLEKNPSIVAGNSEMKSNDNAVWSTWKIQDLDSGIAKIEYGWDLDRQFCNDDDNGEEQKQGFRGNGYTDQYVVKKTYNSMMKKEAEITFKLDYRDSVWAINNEHRLYVRITDNAGNVAEYVNGYPCDMDAPTIKSVEIRKADETLTDTVLRFLSFGTYSNKDVEVAVIAEDIAEENCYASGVKKVELNGQEMTLDSTTGEYVLTVNPDKKYAMKIKVCDGVGRETVAAVTNITDETGLIKSDNLIVENDSPVVSWDFSDEGQTDANNNVWFGYDERQEKLIINVADSVGEVKSGLYSIKITDNGTVLFEQNGFSTETLSLNKEYVIGNFANGKHTIVVTAEDNAGNVLANVEQKTFYIDTAAPTKGTVSVESPAATTIDNKKWFDKNDVIKFRIDSSDTGSGIKEFKVNINGQNYSFQGNNIQTGADGNYVVIDTTGINLDSAQKYTVSGTVTDYAGNDNTIKQFVVYKDLYFPKINNLTVEAKNSTLGKILNVLSFGAYANDTVVLKAYVSDSEYDSGIDYVTVQYEGLTEAKKMTKKENGVFAIDISAEDIYESNVFVTAYDKFGNSSVTCPFLTSVDGEDETETNYIMIEDTLPSVTLNLPSSDLETQDNGPRWYDGSNKEIQLIVQDTQSGLRDIDLKVNDVDITCDKNGKDLLKTTVTEAADDKNVDLHTYIFDTDYFAEKAGDDSTGEYVISINVTDNAGNVAPCSGEYFIDKIAPEIDNIKFEPISQNGVSETTEFVEEFEYGYYFKTGFKATVWVSDEEPSAGLNSVQYRLVTRESDSTQEAIGVAAITENKAEIDIPEDFKGQIFVDVSDNVNNHFGEKTTKGYVVDSAAPEINIIKNASTPYVDGAGNELYVSDTSITVEITDFGAGLKEFGYSQSSEQSSFDRKNITIGNNGYEVGDDLGDGWIVSAVDVNLVTKVVKTFSFTTDDNDVSLTFDATDNAINKVENVKSNTFTIDKTQPIITVVFGSDSDEDVYYNQNRVATITVTERNFDPSLINVAIQNAHGSVPSVSFAEISKTEHVAVIEFDEGDYTFDVSGTDMGHQAAAVSFSGGNEKMFFVDKTAPQVEENFGVLIDAASGNSFNGDKVVSISITEHNFRSDLTRLSVWRKAAGTDHTADGLTDVTAEVLRNIGWSSAGDVHFVSFTLANDAVYQVKISPVDLAGNEGEARSSAVFEIDKTIPVITSRNGDAVKADNTELLDIYTYDRADEPAPTIEFEDLNIAYIKYYLTVYTPNSKGKNEIVIEPVRVYLNEDKNKSGRISGNKFTLPEFEKDGVYTVELVAVDEAGNESLLNVNTYVRLIEQDVLAYIMDSSIQKETGLYSFQYENGDAISKRPDNFKDLKIFVLTKADTAVDVVLRDSNGEEFNTNSHSTTDDSIYGMMMYYFTLDGNYFKENFQDDTDVELYLSVKNEENRIDLGKMHIDNIAPECEVPEEFKSWKWFFGSDDRTIMLSNISELIDVSQSKVYANGNEIEYTYSSEDNALKFTLGKGWHNVGVTLKDMAGNTYNIQEITNVHIGYFWLWVILGVSIPTVATITFAILRNRRKRRMEENNM